MGVKGDFAKLERLAAAFTALSNAAMPLTAAAARAAEQVSARSFDREAAPTGRRWAALAPSTLRNRPPGKKLAGLLPARVWQVIGAGRFRVTSPKDYDLYHTTGTSRMPQREDLPVNPGGMLVYGRAIHAELVSELRKIFLGLR